MAGSSAKTPAFPWLLFVFVLCYPLVFFPGALPGEPPVVAPFADIMAREQFLFVPKLLFLLTVGMLGFLEVRKQITRSVFLLLMLTSLALVILSTCNARDELTFSLLGPAWRLDGLLYYLGLFLVGVFAYTSLRQAPQHFVPVAAALVIGSCIQTLIILLQTLGLDQMTPLRLLQDFHKAPGTLGNPGMVAGFLLPAVLVALWLGLQERHRPYRFLWLAGALVSAAGLGITENGAAFYALIATLAAMNLFKRHWGLLFLSLLVLVAVLAPRALIIDPRGIEGVAQDYQDTASLKARFVIWQIALRGIGETPLQPFLGGGPDAMRLAQLRDPPVDLLAEFYALEFGWPPDAKIQDAQVKRFSENRIRDQWIAFNFERFGGQQDITKEFGFVLDRAHNFVLDRWLAFGLVSVVVWLILYLYPIYLSLRRGHWLGWVFVALMIYYLAWFPVMQVEPIHLVLLAAAWAVLLPAAKAQPPAAPG
jgi:O-antigen ligase